MNQFRRFQGYHPQTERCIVLDVQSETKMIVRTRNWLSRYIHKVRVFIRQILKTDILVSPSGRSDWSFQVRFQDYKAIGHRR